MNLKLDICFHSLKFNRVFIQSSVVCLLSSQPLHASAIGGGAAAEGGWSCLWGRGRPQQATLFARSVGLPFQSVHGSHLSSLKLLWFRKVCHLKVAMYLIWFVFSGLLSKLLVLDIGVMMAQGLKVLIYIILWIVWNMFQPNVVNNSTDVFCSQLRLCTCFGQWTRTQPPSFGYLNAIEQTKIHKTDSPFMNDWWSHSYCHWALGHISHLRSHCKENPKRSPSGWILKACKKKIEALLGRVLGEVEKLSAVFLKFGLKLV